MNFIRAVHPQIHPEGYLENYGQDWRYGHRSRSETLAHVAINLSLCLCPCIIYDLGIWHFEYLQCSFWYSQSYDAPQCR
ncbi:hypothetical protein EYC84_003651 [Monilinia fructicola]|uniref:Uncharacterized protein n=1 Tax=Monilinia fructicola TaxID=38448 RepID=A0A5M9K2K0_MONFR|nr:hypothetical protein EYC84_003651 [Monilinia fructicola]